jgi:hypothetical protein
MRRWCALLCALFLGLGCATDGSEWDDFKKDLRGDNIEDAVRSRFQYTGQP